MDPVSVTRRPDWRRSKLVREANTLAERVRLRALRGRFQDRQTHRLNHIIDGSRKEAVAVVNEKSMQSIIRNNGAELLDSPFARRVLRDIPMHDPMCSNVQDDKHIQHSEAGRNGDEEIAGEHGALAWLRTKVLQRWDDTRSRGRPSWRM
jgi:hypothetical protein